MALAFFCRGRPQGCDAFPIFEQASRVFIGYPLPRRKEIDDPTALRDCLVDPSCPDEEWLAVKDKNRNHSRNRNFVGKINQALDDGVIVIVPRPVTESPTSPDSRAGSRSSTTRHGRRTIWPFECSNT